MSTGTDPLGSERTARVTWACLSEPADPVAHELVGRLGLLEGLDLVLNGSARARHRRLDRFAKRVTALDLDGVLRAGQRAGARLVVPGDEEWPEALADLPRPPWCLWVRGPADLGAVLTRSVAVVGARAATSYGDFLTGQLAAGLADRGFTVVSGAAYGIDGAAHRGALAVEGTTVAVVAGGVDRVYPTGHARLLASIGDSGAVVSEVPPGSAPSRTRFLARNRLIAAMTGGTVVVEAGLRSGALSTAHTAAELGRPVGAVPGPVTSSVSAGCHEAVRRGWATLVTDAEEVADLVGDVGEDSAPARRGEERPEDALDELCRRVLEAIPPYRSRTVDDLARIAALSAGEVLAALGQLEASGLVERRLDGWGRGRRR